MDTRREIPVAAPAPGLPGLEVARLEALRRLAMGAAHAMNNAFTAVLAEAQFLYDDRKEDPEVVEACETILEQVGRCGRITRALLARRHPSQAGAPEVDLARLVRELGNLLRETLSSGTGLEVEFPDDLVLVRGDPDVLEVAVLTLVHFAADEGAGSPRLRLRVFRGDVAGIRLEVESRESAERAAAGLREPAQIEDGLVRCQIEALRDWARLEGGRLVVEERGPQGFAVQLELPRA